MKKIFSIFISVTFLLKVLVINSSAENNPLEQAEFSRLISIISNNFSKGHENSKVSTIDVEKFLDQHNDFDVNFLLMANSTPLTLAVRMSNLELVNILLKHGADPLYESDNKVQRSSIYYAKFFCEYFTSVNQHPEISERFYIGSPNKNISLLSLENCLREKNCNLILENILGTCKVLRKNPIDVETEMNAATYLWHSKQDTPLFEKFNTNILEKPNYKNFRLEYNFEIFKFNPIESNWISSRVSFKLIKTLIDKLGIFFLNDIDILKNEYCPSYIDAENFLSFNKDTIIYVVTMYYYTNYYKKNIIPNNSFEAAEERLTQMRETLNTVKSLLNHPLRTDNVYGPKPKNQKFESSNKTITYDYHGLDTSKVYPFTVKVYENAMIQNNLQNINIITGLGNHSLNGVSISGVLVMFFSCKNQLDSVLLEDNPGIISFRIHR